MTRIETEAQYRRALQRVEELLPHVKDGTPVTDLYSINPAIALGV